LSQAPRDTPLLSVVIPAYNQAAFLRETLESVLQQAGEEVEVIVVNDGSTDATLDVIAGFAGRVRCVTQPNAGLAAARNRGHREARGEFVAWLDSDDLCEPGRLALQMEVLRRHPEVGLVSGGFSAFNADGLISPSFAAHYYGQIGRFGLHALYGVADTVGTDTGTQKLSVPLYRGKVYPAIAYGNFVHPPTVMMRREVWTTTGELDAEFPSAADWDFFVRASRKFSFAYLDYPLLRYRLSAGQMSSMSNALRHVPREMLMFERMLAADPALRADASRVRELYRSWYFTMATAAADTSRWLAMKYLVYSLYHGCAISLFLRTALKLALPDFLVSWLQGARRTRDGQAREQSPSGR